MIIKWLLVPAVIAAVILSLRARASLRGQARRKIMAAVTVVAGVLAVIFPDSLQVLAESVGVTRGTDLLLYLVALTIIYLVGSTGVRFREQEARLVVLAREVALAEAEARFHARAAVRDAAVRDAAVRDGAVRVAGVRGAAAPTPSNAPSHG
jgi:hypothetical protein